MGNLVCFAAFLSSKEIDLIPEVSFVYCGSSSVDLNFQVAFCLGHSLSQNCYERLSPRADLCYYAFTIY